MSTQLKIKNVRIAFPSLFKLDNYGNRPRYACTLIIPKDHPQIAEIKKTIVNEGKEKFAKQLAGGKWPASLNYPLHDGDEDGKSYAKDSYYIRIKSKSKPLVVSPKRQVYKTEEECPIQSGSYVNVIVSIAPYDNVQKGVGMFFNAVQFKAEGPYIGAGESVTAFDFDEEEEDELPFSDDPYGDLYGNS